MSDASKKWTTKALLTVFAWIDRHLASFCWPAAVMAAVYRDKHEFRRMWTDGRKCGAEERGCYCGKFKPHRENEYPEVR